MCKKFALLTAVLMLAGAVFMLFGHNKAEAKVCFVNDPDCSSNTTVYGADSSNTCSNLGYTCTSTLANCINQATSSMVSWVSSTISTYSAYVPSDNPSNTAYWKLVTCPYNHTNKMACPKGFQLSCTPGIHKSTTTCGGLRDCVCKDDYKFRASIYNGVVASNTAENPYNVENCYAAGVGCQDVLPNGSLSQDVKYSVCECRYPYVTTSATCQELGAEVDASGGTCRASTSEEKYYIGCICPDQYQYVAGDARCPFGVDGGPCISNSISYYSNCHQDCDGMYASRTDLANGVINTTVGTPGSVYECNLKGTEDNPNGGTPAGCRSRISGLQSNGTYVYLSELYEFHLDANSHVIFDKDNRDRKIIKSEYLAYPNANRTSPQVFWKRLPKFSYLGCSLNDNVSEEHKRYYILSCAEPGMRPSTSSDLVYDEHGDPVLDEETGEPKHYHNGEACVPVSCENAVMDILESSMDYYSSSTDGLNNYGVMLYSAKTISGESAEMEGGIYFVDGKGDGIVERLVNGKNGGRIQTSTTQRLEGQTYDADNQVWTADLMGEGNGTQVQADPTNDWSMPARKIAILLPTYGNQSGVAYQYVDEDNYSSQHLSNTPATNYTQHIYRCSRLACFAAQGDEMPQNREYWRVPLVHQQNGQIYGNLNENIENPDTLLEENCQTAFVAPIEYDFREFENGSIDDVTEVDSDLFDNIQNGKPYTPILFPIGGGDGKDKDFNKDDGTESETITRRQSVAPKETTNYHWGTKCEIATELSEKPFWNFGPENAIVKGNLLSHYPLYSYKNKFCGGYDSTTGKCSPCYRGGYKKVCAPKSGSNSYSQPLALNPINTNTYYACPNSNGYTYHNCSVNCLAGGPSKSYFSEDEFTGSTIPSSSRRYMRLQSMGDGFCTTTYPDPQYTLAGIQGIPADEYISVGELYRRIVGAVATEYDHIANSERDTTLASPTYGDLRLNSNLKAMYKKMLERSCMKKNSGEITPNHYPVTNIIFDGSTFPVEGESNNSSDWYVSEHTITMKGINLKFNNNSGVRVNRYFVFTDGTLSKNNDTSLTIERGHISNSTILAPGSGGFTFKGDMENSTVTSSGTGALSLANTTDTDIDFCGTFSLASGTVTFNSTDGSHTIHKSNNCANAELNITDVFTSKGYSYALDNMSISVGNALDIGDYKALFDRAEANNSQRVSIHVSDTLTMRGNVVFGNTDITASSNTIIGGDTPCSATATFVNMHNSLITMPLNSTFEIKAKSAIGKARMDDDDQGKVHQYLMAYDGAGAVLKYEGTVIGASIAAKAIKGGTADPFYAYMPNNDGTYSYLPSVTPSATSNDKKYTIFQEDGTSTKRTCSNAGNKPTAYRFINSKWQYKLAPGNATTEGVNEGLFINNNVHTFDDLADITY